MWPSTKGNGLTLKIPINLHLFPRYSETKTNPMNAKTHLLRYSFIGIIGIGIIGIGIIGIGIIGIGIIGIGIIGIGIITHILSSSSVIYHLPFCHPTKFIHLSDRF
jgi:hypothetical protein